MNRTIRNHTIVTLMVAAVTLAGCVRGTVSTPQEGLIRLGVRGATRAVNTLDDLAAVGDNLGIYGLETGLEAPGLPGTADFWGTTPLMANVRTTSVDAASGVIGWSGSYYYPAQSNSYVAFCAYHPYGVTGDAAQAFYVEAPAAGQAPRLHFTLSGAEDVMSAGPVFGRHDVTPAALEFRHVLTQLRFQVVDAYASMGGVAIRAVTLTGVNRTSEMEIGSGVLGAWSNPGEIAVPGIAETPITGTPAAPQPLGGEVMLQPGLESFTLRVETSGGTYDEVTIRPTSSIGGVAETSFAAGRSYLITLTFQKLTGIVASATVVPWEMAGTGEVIIQ